MKEIGGYFNLELPLQSKAYPQSEGIHLNTGRNALEYILRALSVKKLWIPYFTCNVILEPLRKLGVEYHFYRINEKLEIADNIRLENGAYLLVTNYYGIKDAYVASLAKIYGKSLIVDNAQAFYAPYLEGTHAFYSPRKFVGLPDGGIAYTTAQDFIIDLPQDISYNRCSHLLKRIDLNAGAGYADFRENSHKLVMQNVSRMSNLTRSLLQAVDFAEVRRRRRENFEYLHQALSASNLLKFSEDFACPMVYPYYSADASLKQRLIENKIFVATYWPNVFEWCEKDTVEYNLADGMIAIPIDQRYTKKEMFHILTIIENERKGCNYRR